MRRRNAILIQISRTFRHGMSDRELYEATIGTWRIGERREEAEYALAVAGQEVREVYRIDRWDKAGTHKYETRDQDDVTVEGRWEFSGAIAEDVVRNMYLGYKTGKLGQSPIRYIYLIDSRILFDERRILTTSETITMSETNAILIQISRTFREGMSPLELYEATRGTWVIGERREEVEYVLAVAGGEIREVYGVERWDEAGTYKYKTRDQDDVTVEGRWEFSGFLAEDAVRNKYVGRKVEQKQGQANPIRYIELSDLHTLLH